MRHFQMGDATSFRLLFAGLVGGTCKRGSVQVEAHSEAADSHFNVITRVEADVNMVRQA